MATLSNEPAVTGGAISAALVAVIGVLAVVFKLDQSIVLALNSAVAACVVAISVVVRSKVTPYP
jgi:hypothetical protein